MGKVQRIGEEIVKDILGEVGKDLKNNKSYVIELKEIGNTAQVLFALWYKMRY